MAIDTTRLLTYEGPPALVSALADQFDRMGVQCQYEPPLEHKDLATALSVVNVALAATGPLPNIIAAVQAFRQRFPQTSVGGLPALARVQERLAVVEQLFADGDIDAGERSR